MRRLAALAALLLLAAACTAPPPARQLSPDALDEESPRPSRRKAPAQADLSSLPALSLDALAPSEEPPEEIPRN
ncbi:MAG: hypothetical protein ACP5VN_07760, partial [Acidobacteriota bacterium]